MRGWENGLKRLIPVSQRMGASGGGSRRGRGSIVFKFEGGARGNDAACRTQGILVSLFKRFELLSSI
jgi:hypothetical protein